MFYDWGALDTFKLEKELIHEFVSVEYKPELSKLLDIICEGNRRAVEEARERDERAEREVVKTAKHGANSIGEGREDSLRKRHGNRDDSPAKGRRKGGEKKSKVLQGKGSKSGKRR